MAESRTCSACGAVIPHGAPAGQCIRCLLGFAEEDTEGPSQAPRPRAFGDFEFLDEGKEGGMGVVYRVRQTSLKRVVALKMIRSGNFASANEVQRFHIEAEAAASLDHPHIVPIYEVGEHEGQHYFIMKWIEGRSIAEAVTEFAKNRAEANLGRRDAYPTSPLGRRDACPTTRPLLKRSGAVSGDATAASLMVKVARAVQHAHERGILHRDLKPGNILIDAQGEPHVTDFGLAKRMDSNGDLTGSNAIIGTPSYMAPEQAEGKVNQLTTACDIFALGSILYRLLTGRSPFTGDTPLEIIRKVIEEEPPRPRTVHQTLSRDLETICLKCLEKDPQKRYDSAGKLAQDLQNWLEGKPIEARPVGDWERGWKWAQRHPAVSSLSLAVFLSIVLGLIGVSWQWQRAERQRSITAAANTRLELQRAEDFFAADKADLALATLARLVRDHPQNRAAAERIINALNQRAFLIPAAISSAARAHPKETSLDGKRRVRGEETDSFVVLDASTGASLTVVTQAHSSLIRHIEFSPDGQRVITASSDFTAKVWDAQTGGLLRLLPHSAAVYWAEFSPDGSNIVTATANPDSAARLWDSAGRLVGVMRHLDAVNSSRFNTNGELLATASDDKSVRLWNGKDGIPICEPARLSQKVDDADFSVDGRQIIVTLEDGQKSNFTLTQIPGLIKAALTEVPSPQAAASAAALAFKPRLLKNHSEEITFLDLAPNGKVVASASVDKSARLWDARPLQPLAVPLMHDATVNCVRFSPDGLRVVTSTARPTRVRIWDVETGAPLSDWIMPNNTVAAVRFSDDGCWIVLTDGSSANWKWPIHPVTAPAPAWLPELAEAIAGVRYTANGLQEAVAKDSFARLQLTLLHSPRANALADWASELMGFAESQAK